jgi:hypothetical protein
MLAKIDRPAKEEQMRDLLKKDMVGSWVGLDCSLPGKIAGCQTILFSNGLLQGNRPSRLSWLGPSPFGHAKPNSLNVLPNEAPEYKCVMWSLNGSKEQ